MGILNIKNVSRCRPYVWWPIAINQKKKRKKKERKEKKKKKIVKNNNKKMK